MKQALFIVTLAAISLPPAAAQDQAKVEAAIRRGSAWLKKNDKFKGDNDRHCERELVLLTLSHAGVPESDRFFKKEFETLLKQRPQFTYRTALRAMLLEEVQRVKHQHLLFHCAEFFVDNQAASGIWGYGKKTIYSKVKPLRTVATGGSRPKPGGLRRFGRATAPKIKPKVVRRLKVTPKKSVAGGGDNSNSQYAALGLRSCHDAGIIIPAETIARSITYWRNSQQGDGGGDRDIATSDGLKGKARGWDYKNGDKPYGSMSAGAVGALAIYLYMQGKEWKKDQDLVDGCAWLADNFSVTSNPKKGGGWHYYYLYGLERAAVLYDTPKFGSHDWYSAGAKFLLGKQGGAGNWGGRRDTCFAILFLKRATRPLVVSEDVRRR